MSINKIFLVGKISDELNLRYTGSGMAVCSFSLETAEKFKNKSGEKQERVEKHNIVAWAELAEFCNNSTSKGSQLYIEGRIQRRDIEEEGNKRYITEIIANKVEVLESSGQGVDEDDDDGVFDPDKVPF